jgi:hypothetical protein
MPGYKDCLNGKWLIDNVIYLPFHPSVPDQDLRIMIEQTIDAYHELMKYLQ